MRIQFIRRPGLSNPDKYLSFLIGPITLPYYPKAKPYKVYAQQFDSVNAKVGCFDTSHILKIVDPDGNEIR